MRKYQQLLLILISLISISILIIYKSENERLTNVLNVVNFFGQQQKDSSIVKMENYTNFTYNFAFPLPSFTNLGNSFHGYSAFWKKTNELKAGGMVIAIVVASDAIVHSPVSFQVCKQTYKTYT